MDVARIIEICVTIMGLLYLWWEFHANSKMWIMGIIMPAIDIYLYWNKGVYGNMWMSSYYLLVAVYGLFVWRFTGKRQNLSERPISHISLPMTILLLLLVLVIWGVTYYLLSQYTTSTVPMLDALTNALSIVGMIALARKYLQQWIFWIVYDLSTVYLDAIKDLPFKAGIHLVYATVAVFGYMRWKKQMLSEVS